MKALVACEESQAVTIELRKLGVEAYSCDIQECSGGHPERHIKGDVLEILEPEEHYMPISEDAEEDFCIVFFTCDGHMHFVDYWDLIIAHPPCTYMSNAGACRMYPHKGQRDPERFEKAMLAKSFFMAFYNADCPHICIENPRPLNCVGLPKESQRIQPWLFGEPWSKLTYLWLKGLPLLKPTEIVTDYKPYVSCGTSRNKGNPDKSGFTRKGGASRARSKTFPGIARAMATQWVSYIRETEGIQ